MITILNREIPNQVEELTIEQFEAITDINNDPNLDPIDKHLRCSLTLGYLSLSSGIMMWLTSLILLKTLTQWTQKDFPVVEELELEGYLYKAQ
jgi:hypothetical protein